MVMTVILHSMSVDEPSGRHRPGMRFLSGSSLTRHGPMVRPTFYKAMARGRADAGPPRRTCQRKDTDEKHQARDSTSHTTAALHQSCQRAPGLPITIREAGDDDPIRTS